MEEANDLARTPRFYNTLTANCTNLVFGMVRVIHPGLPMDARVLFSGYLPNYAYDLGATDTSISFEKLRGLAKIHDKAAQADADPNFSAKFERAFRYRVDDAARAPPPSAPRQPRIARNMGGEDRETAGLALAASPVAMRKPETNSSRCATFRCWLASGITIEVMALSRSTISRASSSRPIWA